jgi:hypothetical protein
MQGASGITFPLYLLKGEMVELDGRCYVMPHAVACENAKDLVSYIYRHGLKPVNGAHPPFPAPHESPPHRA